jgi:hypothetical protein
VPVLRHRTDDKPDLDPASKIWRYVDITSLVVMLDRRRLHFPLLSALGDPWEGAPAVADLLDPGQHAELDQKESIRRVKALQNKFAARRDRVAASCWYLAEAESAAMWDLYAARGRGIALQTTVGALRDSLDPARDVWLGRVRYDDYQEKTDSDADNLSHAFRKREAYAHENEVRFVTELSDDEVEYIAHCREYSGHHWGVVYSDDPSKPELASMRDFRGASPEGLALPIDPNSVIKRVVLAPSTPAWQAEAVRALLERFGVRERPEFSGLSESPPWRRIRLFMQLLPEELPLGPSPGPRKPESV